MDLYLIEVKDSEIIDYKKIKESEIEIYLPEAEDTRLLKSFGGWLCKHEKITKKIYWIVNLDYTENEIAIDLNPNLYKMIKGYITHIKRDLKLNSLLK